jgi:TPR repeat protein
MNQEPRPAKDVPESTQNQSDAETQTGPDPEGPDSNKMLQAAAEAGNLDAMYELGRCLDYGEGVDQDQEAAVEWYRKAAAQGHDGAMYELARSLESGVGVDEDQEEAVEWFRKAAEAGNLDAMYELGRCLDYGEGVDQDQEAAVEWYRKAAAQGHDGAMYELARSLASGTGVEGVREEALMWFRKAADAGNADAMLALAACLEFGNGVNQNKEEATTWVRKAADAGNVDAMCELASRLVSDAGFEEAPEEAALWFRKAAEAGHTNAMFALGRCLEGGMGVDPNREKAVEWYRKAAAQGHDGAMYELARSLASGVGVDEDPEEAVEWFRKAAVAGHTNAMFNLALCLTEAEGVDQNQEEAVEWYGKAAEAGHAGAMVNLGFHMQHGRGTPRDTVGAVEWYRRAANLGSAQAMNNLGKCLHSGTGVVKDLAAAADWFRRGAEAGESTAMANLAYLYLLGEGVPKSDAKAREFAEKALLSSDRAENAPEVMLEMLERESAWPEHQSRDRYCWAAALAAMGEAGAAALRDSLEDELPSRAIESLHDRIANLIRRMAPIRPGSTTGAPHRAPRNTPPRTVAAPSVPTARPISRANPGRPEAERVSGVEIHLGAPSVGHGQSVRWQPCLTGSPHLFIVGIPGQGKSVTTLNIIDQLARQGVPSVVVDFHGSYANSAYADGSLGIRPIVAAITEGLPFSPFEADLGQIGARPTSPEVNCQAVAEVFGFVCSLGPIQQDVVYEALRLAYGLEIDDTDVRATTSQPGALPTVATVRANIRSVSTARKCEEVLARCRPILDFGLFSASDGAKKLSGDAIIRQGMVLDVHDSGLESCQVAAGAFLLRHIYKAMFKLQATKTVRLAIVVDEAHRLSKDKTIPLLMREGRKYGIAVILASQGIADFPDEVLENAGSRIAFRTNAPQSRRVAGLMASDAKSRSDIQATMERLGVGTALVRTEKAPASILTRMSAGAQQR